MSKLGRVLAGAVACTLVAAGPAGASVAAKQKKVSAAKYAKAVCAVQLGVFDLLDAFSTDFTNVTTDDPVTFQNDAVGLASTLVDDVAKLQNKLKKQYPDVDNGKRIGRIFAANIGEVRTAVTEARDKFQAADATSPAFSGDVAQFSVAFQVFTATLSDPFSQVTDQDLLKAFDDEKSCKGVVKIYGG